MQRNRIGTLSLALGAVLLASCGRGILDLPTAASGDMSSLASSLAGTTGTTVISTSLSATTPTGGSNLSTAGSGFQGGLVRRALGLSEAPADRARTCTKTTLSGDPAVDVDGDFVAAAASEQYACNINEGTNGTYSTNFTFTQTDKDDTDANSGVTLELSETTFTYNLPDFMSASGSLGGRFDLTVDSTTKARTSDYRFRQRGDMTISGQSVSFSSGEFFTGTRAPRDASFPAADADVDLTGFWEYHVSSASQSVALTLKLTVDVVVDDACPGTGPVSGTVRFEDGAGNVLLYTYSGCATGAWTYNDSPTIP